MDRIVFITDSYSCFAPRLLVAFLAVLRDRPEISAAAVVDTGETRMTRVLRRYAARSVVRLFNPSLSTIRPGCPGRLKRICNRYRIPLCRIPGKSINQPEVREKIKHEFNANLVLVIDCLQKFNPEFLNSFDMVVNYHNGLLPAYRGLRATEWALYQGESRLGFSFHVMNEKIDGGNILVMDSIPVDKGFPIQELEDKKTECAAAYGGKVIAMMAKREQGIPQTGEPGYYSRRRFMNIRKVGDPSSLTWNELSRRIELFGPVSLQLNHRLLPVSAAIIEKGNGPFHFTTSDGVTARATRFFHLPYSMYSMANHAGLIP